MLIIMNENIKNILKAEVESKSYMEYWSDTDEKSYKFDLNYGKYKEVTGVDLGTLAVMNTMADTYGLLYYCKVENGIDIVFETFTDNTKVDKLSGCIHTEEDFLGLFTEDSEMLDKIEKWLDSDTPEFTNFEKLMELITDKYKTEFLDYVENSSMESEIVENFINYNTGSACELLNDSLGDTEARSFVQDLIERHW